MKATKKALVNMLPFGGIATLIVCSFCIQVSMDLSARCRILSSLIYHWVNNGLEPLLSHDAIEYGVVPCPTR